MNQSKHSSAIINRQNTIELLRLIWRHGEISRAELAKISGLSAPTVSRIVERLITVEGLVRDQGVSESPQGRGGGRPPNLLVIDGENAFIVGVDLSIEQIQGVITDLHAQVRIRLDEAIPAGIAFPEAMHRANTIIRRMIDKAGIRPASICGVGIALTGLLGDHHAHATRPGASTATSFPLALRFPWRETQCDWEFGDLAGLPFFFSNTAHALANGELWFGQGSRFDNFVCINVRRDSLATGIVIDGRPISGVSSHGGGFGHLTLDKNSPLQCRCGNYGCLEVLATGRGLEHNAAERLKSGEKSRLSTMTGGHPERINDRMIFEAARKGDKLAQAVLDEAAEYIGVGIAGAINLFQPQAIIVGGLQVDQAGESFFQRIQQTARQRAIDVMAKNVEVLPMSRAGDTVLFGAVSLVLQQVLNLEIPLPSRVSPARPL